MFGTRIRGIGPLPWAESPRPFVWCYYEPDHKCQDIKEYQSDVDDSVFLCRVGLKAVIDHCREYHKPVHFTQEFIDSL